jgi:hypothetical protein
MKPWVHSRLGKGGVFVWCHLALQSPVWVYVANCLLKEDILVWGFNIFPF